ncbi:uncharacterized protein LOC105183024, partial [Harpegnathos saltator]|uniref:uncharacterized protein LOC105183024 n=1 Tax=Harpegnathos saltator TaxID=610380 RepID=UPI000DBED7A9
TVSFILETSSRRSDTSSRVDTLRIATSQIAARAKEQNREEYNRINALTVFLQDTEREAPSGPAAQSDGRLPALSATRHLRKSRRAARKPAKGTTESQYSAQDNKGGDERRCEGSERTNVCTRARLANVERQQSSKSSWAPKAHSDPAGNLDPRKDRSSNDINGSPRLDTVPNLIQTKRSRKGFRAAKAGRDIIAENITKQGKKVRPSRVRVPATRNLVYEFRLSDRAERTNSLTPHVRSLPSARNPGQGSALAKTGVE